MVWNTLNYPACAFPVTTVDPVQDPVQPRDKFLGEQDKENHAVCMSTVRLLDALAAAHNPLFPDNPETYKNAPVGLQLAGQTLEDEAVVAMTEIVDKCLKEYKAARGIA